MRKLLKINIYLKNMKDDDYELNNFTERPTVALGNSPGTAKKIKCIILLSIFAALIIVGVLILLYYLVIKEDNDDEPSHNPEELVGEIICLYDIKDISKETSLLGDNFGKLSSLEI